MTAKRLEFLWTPGAQRFSVDDRTFVNRGKTETSPSHDVAHLLLAAGGSLEWLPDVDVVGDDNVRLAEFNAVTLEHLANKAAVGRDDGSALTEALEHARWFAEVYYGPFPLPYEEAIARFRRGLDVATTLRLAPIFFHQRAHELATPDFLARNHGGRFSSADAPPLTVVSAGPVARFARLLARFLRQRDERP